MFLTLLIMAFFIIIFNTIFLLSACKVAGRCDKWEEEIIKDIKKDAYIS
jgi:hypothetical protein